MKTKLMTLQDATGFFRDGMTIMVGGFMGIGTPSRLVEALLESGVRDLTLIANDTAFVDTGIGPLIVNGRVRKVIASHIGTNPETGRRAAGVRAARFYRRVSVSVCLPLRRCRHQLG